MSKERIAAIISFVFDPLVEVPILFIFFLSQRTVSLWLLLLIFLFGAILPLLFMIYGLKVGFITDWETSNRDERHGFNLVWFFGVLLSLFFAYLLKDEFLFKLLLIFAVLLGLYTLITFFWKISGHMTANTAFVLLINLFSNWRFWPLGFILPMVAWARLARNKHDIWQILGGVILSSLVILCGVSLLF